MIIVTIAITFPIVLIKKYTLTNNLCYLIAASFTYIIAVIGYAILLKNFNVHHMFPLWFTSMIIALFSGIIFYDEKIKMINVIGIVFGLLAVCLIVK